MIKSKLLAASIGGITMLACAQFALAATPQTRVAYKSAIDHAGVVYKEARAKCDALAGHDKDMCVVEAKAMEKRSKASAEADYKGTIKSRTDSLIANADADYMVAKVGCDALAGQDKDVCVKQAQANQVKLVADAKAHKTSVEARTDARDETRDAQYKVELAKCDALAGSVKESCVTAAKSAFGK